MASSYDIQDQTLNQCKQFTSSKELDINSPLTGQQNQNTKEQSQNIENQPEQKTQNQIPILAAQNKKIPQKNFKNQQANKSQQLFKIRSSSTKEKTNSHFNKTNININNQINLLQIQQQYQNQTLLQKEQQIQKISQLKQQIANNKQQLQTQKIKKDSPIKKNLTPFQQFQLNNNITNNNKIEQLPKLTPQKQQIVAQEDKSNCYQYIVGYGNNHDLIKRVIKSRPWWTEGNKQQGKWHLNWQPVSQHIDFKNKNQYHQLVNHFEFHKEITTKQRLIKNLASFCKKNNVFLFDYTPLTILVDYNIESYDHAFQEFIYYFMQHSKNLQNDKVVIDLLTRKQFYKALNEKEYKQVNSENKPKTLKKQLQGYTQVRLYKTLFSGQNIWLVKPSDLNRGRDIKVFNNLSQFNKILKEYAEKSFGIETIQTLIQATHKLNQNSNFNGNPNSNTNNQSKQTYISTYGNNNNPKKTYKNFKNNTNKIRKYVIQKYIEQPYLINERKFDIRIWAIVTQDMNLLVFREGYIRTASHQYSVSDQSIANPYIHLTNNAIQKNCQDYGQHEQGNQLSFKQFDEYLKKNQAGGSLYEELFPRMKQIILLSFESVKQKINIFNKQNCFEIFGYDFVIDKELNTWLIEVNTNPCLEESSPLLKQLIPRMMDDAFKLTVDQVFKCQNKTLLQQKQNFPVTGYDDNEILWDLMDISLFGSIQLKKKFRDYEVKQAELNKKFFKQLNYHCQSITQVI